MHYPPCTAQGWVVVAHPASCCRSRTLWPCGASSKRAGCWPHWSGDFDCWHRSRDSGGKDDILGLRHPPPTGIQPAPRWGGKFISGPRETDGGEGALWGAVATLKRGSLQAGPGAEVWCPFQRQHGCDRDRGAVGFTGRPGRDEHSRGRCSTQRRTSCRNRLANSRLCIGVVVPNKLALEHIRARMPASLT